MSLQWRKIMSKKKTEKIIIDECKKISDCYEYATGENSVEIENHRCSLAEKEYERQVSDFALVETRASFAMLLFAIIIPLITAIIENFLSESNDDPCVVAFVAISILLSVICFILLVLVIFSKKVYKLCARDFCEDKYDDFSVYLAGVACTYIDKVEKNAKVYETKHTLYKLACILMSAAFIFTAVSAIIVFI